MGTADERRERRVYVARHGERLDHVDADWARTAAYPHDPPLTARGRRQAHELGVWLQQQRHANVRYILASPFARTVETADCVAEVLQLPVWREHGVSEWLHEAWFYPDGPQLMPVHALQRRCPRLLVPKADDNVVHLSIMRPQYPESAHQMAQRCAYTAQALTQRYRQGDMLIVAHGISVEYVIKGLCGPDTTVNWVTYCSLSECIESTAAAVDGDADAPGLSKWRLGLHCETAHLSEPEDPQTVRYV
ncbi:hypothetical protein CDCA_CDCA04G1271 [Cyanidium caldarium]|uniref:Phosphoglycerate mutase n=1 Tax=Cyanidium caldarium TaxID=2771 RepID=A0AAV9IT33_CYACA|nr:hypothetical protein CDCA_CDCA04G1271 [Cyanidium caldarium]|eukprot:ctg_341.g113